VTHTDSSYGFRVTPLDAGDDGPGLVYSGDCGKATRSAASASDSLSGSLPK